MNKGTILYIGGFELPDKNAAAHRVLNNAKIFRDLGYKVVFVDVDRSSTNSTEISVKKNIQGFDCWSIPYPQSNKQWIKYLSNIDFFIEVLNKYTDVKIVICYNYRSIAFLKIKKYCNKNKIKIIADCTEWYSTTEGANIIFKIVKGFDSFLRMRIIQKRLDGLIVISNYLKKYYKKCKNVICIPPLIDFSEEKWKISIPRCHDSTLHLVYAGNPGRNKDRLNLLIEYLYQLRDISNYVFYIVGITKEQYLKDYIEHSEIIDKLKDRIKFLGRVSHIESLKQIKMADFSVIIRNNMRITQAGFPTKFVESMTCGTPVIATKVGDLIDYLIEGKNGFFIDINDKEKSILILKKVLAMNKKEINDMKKNCLKIKCFDHENYIEQTGKFLSNC